MKKKYLILILLIIIILASILYLVFFTGKTPKEEQIKAICELATLECHYNNVAKSTKQKGEGITHIFEKEREFWIEYEGVAKIGIDMKEVDMKIHRNTVVITMPSAKIMDISIKKETLNNDSYTYSKDGLNKNKVTAEEQQSAVADAQNEMEKVVTQNTSLFEQAEKRAQDLIENYINKLGEISGKNYKIEWKKI